MLKEPRLQLARERGVPACIVFTDGSFIDMVRRPPRTTKEFAEINGTGAVKLKDFWEPFLAAIAVPRTAADLSHGNSGPQPPAQSAGLLETKELANPAQAECPRSANPFFEEFERENASVLLPKLILGCHNHTMEPGAERIWQVKFPNVQ